MCTANAPLALSRRLRASPAASSRHVMPLYKLQPLLVAFSLFLYVSSVGGRICRDASSRAFALRASARTARGSTTCAARCRVRRRCVESRCVCVAGRGGADCRAVVREVPRQPLVVPQLGGVFFLHTVRTGGAVLLTMRLTNVAQVNALPVLFANIHNRSQAEPPLSKLPPVGDDFRRFWRIDRQGVLMREPSQVIVFSNASRDDHLHLAVYAYTRGFPWFAQSSQSPATVVLHVHECGASRSRRCSDHAANAEWTHSVTVLALPVMLGTLALLTIAMCARAWTRVLRRRARAASPPSSTPTASLAAAHDRLARLETNAMFPRFVFEKSHATALGAAGEPSCAVCLSGYEEGESLRRLRCGHSYHADCLDVWLDTNASCPRCRMPARIRVAYATKIAALRTMLCRFFRIRTVADDRSSSPDDSPVSEALV